MFIENGCRFIEKRSLVVLDVKVGPAQVHLLTHTADPIRGAGGGESVYSCTEFVFEFEPEVIRAGRVEPILERIEPLARVDAGRAGVLARHRSALHRAMMKVDP